MGVNDEVRVGTEAQLAIDKMHAATERYNAAWAKYKVDSAAAYCLGDDDTSEQIRQGDWDKTSAQVVANGDKLGQMLPVIPNNAATGVQNINQTDDAHAAAMRQANQST